MRQAIRLALTKMHRHNGGPFGAVVVRQEKIVGRGWNQVTSTNDPTAHAEVVAIRDACRRLQTFRLDDCELYSSCEPCPMCLAALYWAHIRGVYYGTNRRDASQVGFDDASIYREIARPKARRKLPMRQMLRCEAQAVFTAWKGLANKVQY